MYAFCSVDIGLDVLFLAKATWGLRVGKGVIPTFIAVCKFSSYSHKVILSSVMETRKCAINHNIN